MATPPDSILLKQASMNGAPCDLCSVTREAGDLVIRFGQRVAAVTDPRALGVALRHQILLGEDLGAALLDLLTALLNETAENRGGPR